MNMWYKLWKIMPIALVTVTLTIYDFPQVSQLDDQIVCDSFELPTLLANNRYFTQANGQGTELFPGDVITEDATIYIFADAAANGPCTTESSFTVTVYDKHLRYKLMLLHKLFALVKP